MKLHDHLKFKNSVHAELFGPDRKLKAVYDFGNLVTTAGLDWAASQLDDNNNDPKMSYMAVGTGTTPATIGDTTLETEFARVALGSTTRSGSVVTYTATFGPGVATTSITEAGIFNDPTTGTLFVRSVFGVITKDTLDTLVVSWAVSQT